MHLNNDLLLRTLRGEKVERPPVWIMRQAGRTLPQYRKLRESLSGFKELVETPDLAAEVTIQPVDEYDMDAAIIFSDILVIPEAMGLPYEMTEKKGPSFPNTISTQKDIDRLISGEKAAARLEYVYNALKETKKRLNGRVPLIGFSGAPWTLLAYMIEGGGSKTFSKARRFLYQEPQLAHKLLELLTESIIVYLQQKSIAGADVLQLFDSWASALPPYHYKEFSFRYIKRICEAIDAPLIVFAKGAWFALSEFNDLPCEAIGLDWQMDIDNSKKQLPGKVIQGNLDPAYLYASQDQIEKATTELLSKFEKGHIANLGHGVYPDIPLENIKTFVHTVKHFRYSTGQ